MKKRDQVEIRLPASTSNCGPGFDTLSIGLTLYNFCRLTLREDDRIISKDPENDSQLDRMISEAAELFFQTTGELPLGFDFEIWGQIPPARGLGSSATVRGGVILGLNYLTGGKLGDHDCIRLLTRLDHAPDNATAMVRGGFCVARMHSEEGAYVDSFRFPVSEKLSFVVACPEFRVSTPDARAVLPHELAFDEVVRNLNCLAYLVSVFAKGDYERMAGSTVDRVHQPFRRGLNPFVDEAIEAGVAAGAYAGWLSGSGSSVICAVPEKKAMEVRKSMEDIYLNNGVKCRMLNLSADNQGASFLDPVDD